MTDTTSEHELPLTPGSDASAERSRTRPLLLTAAVAVVAAVALWAVVFRPGGSGDSLSSTRFNTLNFITEDGRQATLADFEGKPLVVNFFASWCAPCRAEMPDIESTYQAVGGDGGKVAFIGVNADFTEEAWRSFVAESQVTYPTVFQPDNDIFAELGLIGMPSTVLINADGTVAFLHAGIIDADELKGLISEHLKVPV